MWSVITQSVRTDSVTTRCWLHGLCIFMWPETILVAWNVPRGGFCLTQPLHHTLWATIICCIKHRVWFCAGNLRVKQFPSPIPDKKYQKCTNWVRATESYVWIWKLVNSKLQQDRLQSTVLLDKTFPCFCLHASRQDLYCKCFHGNLLSPVCATVLDMVWRFRGWRWKQLFSRV